MLNSSLTVKAHPCTGNEAVDTLDQQRDVVIGKLRKCLSRATNKAVGACKSEAVYRRAADDADLALDEVPHCLFPLILLAPDLTLQSTLVHTCMDSGQTIWSL